MRNLLPRSSGARSANGASGPIIMSTDPQIVVARCIPGAEAQIVIEPVTAPTINVSSPYIVASGCAPGATLYVEIQ